MTPSPALIHAVLASSSKSTTSPLITLLPLLAIGVLGYFFFIRPQQRKAQAARAEKQSGIEVGDEVQTVGGIIGTVLEIHGDRYTLLTGALGDDGNLDGPQPTRIVFVRQAIARKIEPVEDIRLADQPVVDDDDDDDVEDEHDVPDVRTGGAAASSSGEGDGAGANGDVRSAENGSGNAANTGNAGGRRRKPRDVEGMNEFDDIGSDTDLGSDFGDVGSPKKRSQGAEEA
jgi:preprotein translocase YajC subunit